MNIQHMQSYAVAVEVRPFIEPATELLIESGLERKKALSRDGSLDARDCPKTEPICCEAHLSDFYRELIV